MNYVLSIIANPARRNVDGAFLDDIVKAVASDAGARTEIVELSSGTAYDLQVATPPSADAMDRLRDFGGEAGIDINLVHTQQRRKKLLIADMDSTIIEQECIDELAEFAGRRAEISAITERAMRGELDFEAALKERVAMLKGLAEGVLAETFETRITLTPGAESLVKTMNAHGAVTALISGGFTFFTERIAGKAGFRRHQANELIVAEGVLTGAVREPILGRAAKQEALERIARENRIELADTLAVGDGANDLSMLSRAGLGVAFHAKSTVAKATDAQINHGNLTALLYLQGFTQSEFSVS